ncbi:MAG: lipase family protein [Chiayiivirga sp.]|jgi:triacylglycerol lipase|uniref:lipase family protein n=1 Tax=Chiayiivirga sp. TaxID=2041042 RepID=UPI0025BAE657|nr:lipase family protein [Chiayiivirga sp.]MCI1711828.1 lipase family protein [Chiayiivirga sp.]MCI1729587.1 lipase family protein [Chiayiivirga sp.]
MDAPHARSLPPPSLATLNPPIRGYRYFAAAAHWPFVSGQGIDSLRNTWWMAEHALLAYAEPGVVLAALEAHDYRVQVFQDPASSGHAYVAVTADHAVLAFRGTETVNPGDAPGKIIEVARDWRVDARFGQVPLAEVGLAHGGFVSALDALWPQIEPCLALAPRWWCTGHSLGGALAALAALRLHRAGHALAGAITFGQPRCGDRVLAQALDALPLRRVVNGCDLVPRLPPSRLGFKHGGQRLHLDAQRLRDYGATLRAHLREFPRTLRHGPGALTPIELIDHAPLHYAIKCHNAVVAGEAP